MSLTKWPNGALTFLVENNSNAEKTSAYSVVYNTDSGVTFHSETDNIVFTLPNIGHGQCFTFVNTAEDGNAKMSISPNANDGIMYKNDSTDNKDLINTKATQKKGDSVTVYNVDGYDYWSVGDISGVWAKEA